MNLKPRICPKCNNNLVYQDDSFNHEFGTEIIQFYYCEYCDYQIDAGEEEVDYEGNETKNKNK